MKQKSLIALLLMLLAASVAWGQVTVWQDDFNDNNVADWTISQSTSCSVQSGRMVFTRTGTTGTPFQYFTSPIINATLAETFLLDVVLTNYADTIFDRGRLDFSADGGSTWTEITTGNFQQGTNRSYAIAPQYRTANFRLRIKYRLHNTASRLELDNFRITRPGVGISPTGATPLVGQTVQFTASGGISTYVWSLSNPAVGTITQNGLFTATAVGSTRIRVDSGSDWAETDLINIAYMRITPNTAALWVGDTLQFSAEGGVGTKRFFSNNPAVVTITQQGLLTAAAVGSTTISVRDQNSVVVTSGTITVSEIAEFVPVETLVENTTYPHGPTRLGNSRNIVMTNTGILYTAYQRGLPSAGRDVVLKKSLDGGANWSEVGSASALMTNPRKQYQPAIAVDGAGNVHMTWFGDQTSAAQSYKIWYARYNGSVWTSAVEVSSGSSYVFPSIACDNLGNVLIAYSQQSGTSFVGPYFNKLWNGSWVGQVQVATASVQNSASVTIDRSNGLGVVAWATGYSNPTSANTGRIAWVNPNGTLNGSPSSVLTGLNYDQLQPIFNSQSDLFLFYNLTSPDGGDVIHFRWRANSDGTWRRPLTFDGNLLETCFGSGAGVMPMASFNPQVAIDEYDNIYLIAEGKPTATDDWRIYRNICFADNNPNLDARYGISAWQTLTNAQKLFWDPTDDAAFASIPEKLYNGFNIIPVVWSDGNLVNDGNTGHFPQGQHNNGTEADIRFKSIILEFEPPTVGGVSGYVTLAGTTVPISGALVSVLGTAYSTYTDAGGFYELRMVPVGNYTLRVIAQGYYQAESQITIIDAEMISVNVSLEATPLPAPQNLEALTQGSSVTLTWQAPSNPGQEVVLLREGFEGNTPGWGSWDLDADGNSWGIITSSANAHSGEKMAGSNSFLNNQNLNPNNWLYSPMVQLGYGSTLKFWVGATNPQYYAEKYYLKMSITDNTTAANYTITLLIETLPTANWREKTVDLSAWGGRSVSFAWQHTECSGQSQLILDDILLFDNGAPNPNPEVELSYDPGIATSYYQLNGGTMASRMSPTQGQSYQILRLKLNTRTSPSVTAFNAEIWDWVQNPNTGNWQPGERLYQIPAIGVHNAFTEVDVSHLNIIRSGDFMVGFGSINTQVGMGYSPGNNGRCWDFSSNAWSTWNETYHLRAIVLYSNGRIAELDADGNSREMVGYKIYRNGANLAVLGTDQRTYTDTNVPDGNHIYGVSALYTEGSGESGIVTIQVQVGSPGLVAPTGLQISQDGSYLILNWNAVAGANAYRVEMSSDPYDGFNVLQDNVGASTYMIPLSLITNDLMMYFRIVAKNSRSQSALPSIQLLSQKNK